MHVMILLTLLTTRSQKKAHLHIETFEVSEYREVQYRMPFGHHALITWRFRMFPRLANIRGLSRARFVRYSGPPRWPGEAVFWVIERQFPGLIMTDSCRSLSFVLTTTDLSRAS
jgi:hypothetical protein